LIKKNVILKFGSFAKQIFEMAKERDYILGTHEAEMKRLGLQHTVWQPYVLEGWQKAGINVGSSVLDVGCGPGYATQDLLNIVGTSGKVVGVERSHQFIENCQKKFSAHNNADFHELDLMLDELPGGNFDFAWCRWVACFVNDPKLLVRKIAGALKAGGKVIFHEYINYDGWRVLPPNKYHKEFKQSVISSWRETGGEPDIAEHLLTYLLDEGFEITRTKPLTFCINSNHLFWQWPKTFIEVNLKRQLELGLVTEQWINDVLESYTYKKPGEVYMTTPTVLEIIATKK